MDEEIKSIDEAINPEPTVESLSGFPEGTVLPSGEKIVGTYDENGKLIGFHKEPAGEKK